MRGKSAGDFGETKSAGDRLRVREIEVVDTLFTEDRLRELLAGKTRGLPITLKPWWWWASYTVVQDLD
jgi:hypothetical protein